MKYLRLLLFVCAMLYLPEIGYAQNANTTDSLAVRTLINTLFTGMQNADSAMVRDCFHAEARLCTTGEQANKPFMRVESIPNFVATIGKTPKGVLDERLTSMTIHVDQHLATAWTPYQFYAGGKFSHCGVNAFQCVRTDKGWKILQVTDTRRKNCP
jgi:hypothetical protein